MPDLDKILKMSEIFGVSTDTLLKEEMELNERKTTFEDLQNEQMKTDTSGMTNFCSNQNSTQQEELFFVRVWTCLAVWTMYIPMIQLRLYFCLNLLK